MRDRSSETRQVLFGTCRLERGLVLVRIRGLYRLPSSRRFYGLGWITLGAATARYEHGREQADKGHASQHDSRILPGNLAASSCVRAQSLRGVRGRSVWDSLVMRHAAVFREKDTPHERPFLLSQASLIRGRFPDSRCARRRSAIVRPRSGCSPNASCASTA
jgi:hypothetical protein